MAENSFPESLAQRQILTVTMRSPDGKIEILMKLHPAETGVGTWTGEMEIPGSRFRVAGRAFAEPMVFSADSRFLAVTERFTDGVRYDYSHRVVVFDFVRGKEIIVHTEIQGGIVSLRWTDAAKLCIGAHSHLHGAEEHVWTAHI